MDWTWFLSASAFVVAMSAMPRPNNTMVVASCATNGFSRSVPHMLGIAAGVPVMLVVPGTPGLPLLTDPCVHVVPTWIGAACLLWLAWTIAISGSDPACPAATTSGCPLGVLRVALFQRGNPKPGLIAASAFAIDTAQSEGVPSPRRC